MPLACAEEGAPSFVPDPMAQVEGRAWIEWAPPRYGYTCDHCLDGVHGMCRGVERWSGGACKCNICFTPTGRRRGADAQEGVKQRPARRGRTGPPPKAMDPEQYSRIETMRREGKTWREIGTAEGADFSGLRRKFLAR